MTEKKALSFTDKARQFIKNVPIGKIATYGQIAALSGNPRNARMIAGILNVYSEKDGLPWHRIINSRGCISLKPGQGYEIQKAILEKEGIYFDDDDSIDIKKYQWHPVI